MEPITFDHSQEELCKKLGISEDRADEMSFAAILEIERPDEGMRQEYEILEQFLKQAVNSQERILQAFVAGQYHITNRLTEDDFTRDE